MKSSTVRIVANILGVVGIISSIYIAFVPISIDGTEKVFSFKLFLYAILVTVLSCFVLLAIEKIMKNTEDTLELTGRIYANTTKNLSNNKQINDTYNPHVSGYASNDSNWICKKCSESNPKSSRICRGCGFDK